MSESLERRLRDGLQKAAAFEPRTAQARARFERLSRRRQAKVRVRTASLAAVGATLAVALVGGVGFSNELRDRLGLGDGSGVCNFGTAGSDGNETPEEPQANGKTGPDSVAEEDMSSVDSKPDSKGSESRVEGSTTGGES